MSRHSLRVRRLRILLPIAACALVASIFLWPMLNNLRKLKFESANVNADQLTIVKPHYAAKDDKNNPFEISADRAIQKTAAPDIIHLEKPAAYLDMDEHALNVAASSGIYDKNGKKLALQGIVTFTRDDGLQLHASNTNVDLATGSAVSELPANGTSPDGNIAGQGFNWNAAESLLTVKGPARLILTRGEK